MEHILSYYHLHMSEGNLPLCSSKSCLLAKWLVTTNLIKQQTKFLYGIHCKTGSFHFDCLTLTHISQGQLWEESFIIHTRSWWNFVWIKKKYNNLIPENLCVQYNKAHCNTMENNRIILHGNTYHSTGLVACCSKYGDRSSDKRFVVFPKFWFPDMIGLTKSSVGGWPGENVL